jgi:CheY-like chemotaxis protein
MTSKKIILIDDDEIFVFLTKKAIEVTNTFDVLNVFKNGLEAINFLKEYINKPDDLPEVILLDINMPIMDGWQFLDEYKSIKPKLLRKIIIYIVSSSISPLDLARAKKISDVSDYIIKPITKEKLIDLVAKF